ncbi:MAG: DUF5784 family protein [Haloarculaceae archaeon]
MAGPLRFRRSAESWNEARVRRQLLSPLDEKFGAECVRPWYRPPGEYEACRLVMDNGDLALFVWNDAEAYWMGNTETPEVLWRTDKYTFEEVPYPIARWAQRELLAEVREHDSWLAEYDHLTWFFLPVFLSKDGRESTRTFFRDHAAGFPDASRAEALEFYESVLSTGVLDDHRYTMAAKLGTSDAVDPVRMSATMSEFTVAKLLADAGLAFEPEVELDSGHALDFRVRDRLLEVTRPQPPAQRNASTPTAAVRATVAAKTRDQLRAHPNAVLFVDATSFRDDEWNAIRGEQPSVTHDPAVVFRARPDGHVEGYRRGTLPFDLDGAVDWLD